MLFNVMDKELKFHVVKTAHRYTTCHYDRKEVGQVRRQVRHVLHEQSHGAYGRIPASQIAGGNGLFADIVHDY